MRAQADEGVVHAYARCADIRDDHSLAGQLGVALFKVSDDVGGDKKVDAFGIADDGGDLRPLLWRWTICSSSSPSVISSKAGSMRGSWPRPFHLGVARFEVDRNGGVVSSGALDVVYVDVFAKDADGAFVIAGNGRAGEADEGGVGEGVAHVFGKAIGKADALRGGGVFGFEAVLRAVRLVDDENNVAPVGEHGVFGLAGVGGELVDGGKDDAAGSDLELGAQVGATGGLHGFLAEQLVTGGEGDVEKLVVEVVAVGEDDEGGCYGPALGWLPA